MKIFITFLFVVFTFGISNAQNDNPYAKFGYVGNKLKTPQERIDYMLVIPNQDTLSTVKKIGIDPGKATYYAFGEKNKILYQDILTKEKLSRFFSVDPLSKKYPHYTPYSFSGNEVIHAVELEGLEPAYINKEGQYVLSQDGTSTDQSINAYLASQPIRLGKPKILKPDNRSFEQKFTSYMRTKMGSGVEWDNFNKQLAITVVDIGTEIHPSSAIPKAAYTLFTDKNIVTQQKVDGVDKGLAVASIALPGLKLTTEATKVAKVTNIAADLGTGVSVAKIVHDKGVELELTPNLLENE